MKNSTPCLWVLQKREECEAVMRDGELKALPREPSAVSHTDLYLLPIGQRRCAGSSRVCGPAVPLGRYIHSFIHKLRLSPAIGHDTCRAPQAPPVPHKSRRPPDPRKHALAIAMPQA